jgi:hypothetical protein
MRAVLVLTSVLVLSACGGSKQGGSTTTTPSSSAVEVAVKAQLERGNAEGVVDHGNGPPKLVTCHKDGARWSCRVKTGKGLNMLCLVPENGSFMPYGRKVPVAPQPVCRGIDN